MNIHVFNHNGVWDAPIVEFAKRGHTFDRNIRADVLLHWNDMLDVAIEQIKTAGCPTIVMQHGKYAFQDFLKGASGAADLYLSWDDYDTHLVHKYTDKGCVEVGFYLWETAQIPIDGLPEKYFLYIPSHAYWDKQHVIDREFREAQSYADYYGLPMLYKDHPELNYHNTIRAVRVRTEPFMNDHLGKTLWLIDHCERAWVPNQKQTAWDLYMTRNKKSGGKVSRICDIVEEYAKRPCNRAVSVRP